MINDQSCSEINSVSAQIRELSQCLNLYRSTGITFFMGWDGEQDNPSHDQAINGIQARFHFCSCIAIFCPGPTLVQLDSMIDPPAPIKRWRMVVAVVVGWVSAA